MPNRRDYLRRVYRSYLPRATETMTNEEIDASIYGFASLSIAEARRSLKKAITDVKQQHFVPRSYLARWGERKVAYYSKKRRSFGSGHPKTLLKANRFYKLPIITSKELNFLQGLVQMAPDPRLRQLNEGWIRGLYGILHLADSVKPPPQLRRDFDEYRKVLRNNQLEKHFGHYEDAMADFVKRLGETPTLEDFRDDDEFYNVVLYLATQLLRTQKIRDKMLAGSGFPSGEVSMENVWPYTIMINATSFGSSLVRQRADYGFRILSAGPNQAFLTNDVPVFNLLTQAGTAEDVEEVRIYHPLSPKLALIYEKRASEDAEIVCRGAKLDEVSNFNGRVWSEANDLVLAASEGQLRVSKLP